MNVGPTTAHQLWTPKGIDDLEPEALAAISDVGSISALAGPGSGKTEFFGEEEDRFAGDFPVEWFCRG
jgi:hypothetical protein